MSAAKIFSTICIFLFLFSVEFFTAFALVTKARVYLVKAPTTVAEDGGTTDAGTLDFTQRKADGPVHINGTVLELQPTGKHGFHIHTFGDVERACAAAGAHFNPANRSHGAPSAGERHVGDLGNVDADANGVAFVDLNDATISLNGRNSIIGRTVVVHEKADDLGLGQAPDTKKTGNAGARLACGVIGIVEENGASANAAPSAARSTSALIGALLLFMLTTIL